MPLIPAILLVVLLIPEDIYKHIYNVDMLVCDKVYSNIEGPAPDIKIIGIDEETLTAYGNFSNWSREKSAELVELLCEDEKTAPYLIGFDIMFIGESHDTETDARLVEACKKAGNVVLATNLVYRGETKFDENCKAYYDGSSSIVVGMSYIGSFW